jgi:Tfp pilus assembly protein PilO
MNSGSEKKLSMDELMALNQPVQTAQSTPQPTAQEPTPPPEAYPTKEEWEDLVEYLYTLGYHAERQAGHQKKISESLAQLPTRAQMDELLKAVKRLEEMAEQAGKKKEKRFSIPSIRLPKLHLPESDWPTVVTILMALAVLFLMWWAWGGDWSSLSLLDL